MKRFLTIFISFIIAVTSSAQLNVKKTTNVEKLLSFRSGQVFLLKTGDRYTCNINTSKPKDKGFVLYLGDDKESAIATLKDLEELCETISKGDNISIDNDGKDCIIRYDALNPKSLEFKGAGKAGVAHLFKGEISKMLKVLEN